MSTSNVVSPYAAIAPFYDFLLGGHFFPQLRRVFKQLVSRYGIGFQSVADVACGTGAFVRYLRGLGVPVVYGIDRSVTMLRIALSRNRGNGSRFLQQDFAGLRLPQPVDLITCNFDSLNYLMTPSELLQAFYRFRLNLKPGGWLIFDMITQNQPWISSLPFLEDISINGARLRRWMHMDPYTGLQRSSIKIDLGDRTYQEMHRQRAYPIHLIQSLLRKLDYRILGIHDFESLGDVSSKTRRAVFVVRIRCQDEL